MKSVLFLEYPPCSTCQKAAAWLTEHGIPFERRHIKEARPTAEELKNWSDQCDFTIKKLFNTSGLVYKSLGLKDKLPTMTTEEQYALLATDGMLVKRPLVVGEGFLLAGFRPEDWTKALLDGKVEG